MTKQKAWSDLCDALKVFGEALLESEAAQVEAPAPEVKEEPKKKTRAKKEKAPEPEVKDASDDDILEMAASEPEADDFDMDFGDEEKEEEIDPMELRHALVDYAKANGKEAAYKVLSKFGAKKVDDLKKSDYSKVMAALK